MYYSLVSLLAYIQHFNIGTCSYSVFHLPYYSFYTEYKQNHLNVLATSASAEV